MTKIKVCGLRDEANIREVSALGVDMVGLDFRPQSERYVQMISSMAGIIPDYSRSRLDRMRGKVAPEAAPATATPMAPMRIGVFADDMPQSIIARIYNFELGGVQLQGDESATMIDNLRSSVVPDIAPSLMVIKTLTITTAAHLEQCRQYIGHADMFLFVVDTIADLQLLRDYDAEVPFLLGGSIMGSHAEAVLSFGHRRLAGYDLNEGFESATGIKDVERLRPFVAAARG